MGICKAQGLNPFKKDCYLVKYTQNDPASTIVSIDYFRSRAKAQPDCAGWQSGVIVNDKEDKLIYRKGSFMHPGDELLGGWFRAKPTGWEEPYEWSVNVASYIKKTAAGAPTRFWSDENQPSQISKVAESQGLRRIWPNEFQGLMVEGDHVIDVTQAATALPKPKPQPIQEAASNAQSVRDPEGFNDSPGGSEVASGESINPTDGPTGSDQRADPSSDNGGEAPGGVDDPSKWDLDERKAWVNDATIEQLASSDNEAIKDMKVLNQKERAEICRYVTDRRQVLLVESKKEREQTK
jgi:phage recombination protein Bet